MGRYHSYLNSAATILDTYQGNEPFSSFIKKYFSLNSRFGSRDRKNVSHLCYCYFRMGTSLPKLSREEKIIAGLFLCSGQENELLRELKPEWAGLVHLSPEEKTKLLPTPCTPNDIFPFINELSDGINIETFCQSFLLQPDLFLRIRTGYESSVKQKLSSASISFKEITNNCIALVNSTKTENIINLNKEAVVQDYSSQRIAEFLKIIQQQTTNHQQRTSVWDCCAASGGKSILAKDILGDIDLTVSDIRESIIGNLHKRFKEAGISRYHSFIADLSDPKFNIQHSTSEQAFSVIIADVPCSGSGTWARTPEQLAYFNQSTIEAYSSVQKKIINNAMPYIKHGGYFLYITCSVFKKENEENAAYIKEKFRLEEIKTELLKGYDKKADSMFAALFRNSIA